MPGPLLTVGELSERWSVAVKTIYNWSCDGKLPHPVRPVKIGFGLRFRLTEVEAAERGDRVILSLSEDESVLLRAALATDATGAARKLLKKVERAGGRRQTGVS